MARFFFSRTVWKRIGIGAAGIAGLALLFGIGFGAGFLQLRKTLQTANRDIGKLVAPRHIDEARYVELGGVRQWITIRGQDTDKPVLLFLHGGPGTAIADFTYAFQRPWEDEFVVVEWDQRGAGRSAIDVQKLKGTMTLKQHIADATQLLEYLNKRFGRKVVLVGQSWGTLLGSEVAHRRPDLIHAFVALGQVAGWEKNFAEQRRLVLEMARRTGDKALEAKLTALGPQPTSRENFEAERAWAAVSDRALFDHGHSWHNSKGPWDGRLIALMMASPSLSNAELFDVLTGKMFLQRDNFEQVVKSISGWDIEKNVGTEFEVPYILMMGAHDWQTPITLAKAYYGKVCAPWKAYVEFPYSAHVLVAEEPGRFQRALIEQVLPAVEGRVPAGAQTCQPSAGKAAAR